MVNGKLTKAEKRRRAQQSARDRSSRTSINNNRVNSQSTTQTHTLTTMCSSTATINKAGLMWGKDDKIRKCTVMNSAFPAIRNITYTAVSWRIKSAQAYLIPTVPDGKPMIIGLLMTPEPWEVKTMSDLQACGGVLAKSTVAKISSNTVGADMVWRKTSEASTYCIYFGGSSEEEMDIGMLEVRVVIETRGVAPPLKYQTESPQGGNT